MKSRQNVDFLVVGAGPVGLCMALSLARAEFKVALIDQVDPQEILKSSYDGRTTALAYGSTQFLAEIGLWHSLISHAQPIDEIYVTTENARSHIHYQAKDVGPHPLGYIVENHVLRKHLFEALHSFNNVTICAPAALERITFNEGGVNATLSDGTLLCAAACLAADGKNSKLRQLVGIPTKELPYEQTALVFVIHHHKPHGGRAFEHFLSTGPLAFLPMSGNKSSVVWSLKSEIADVMRHLSPQDFAREVQERFGEHLGDLHVEGKIWSYPLSAVVTRSYISQRLALIGDAAHTIHPVAGQGFNLGLRDVKVLAALLVEAQKLGLDLGSATLLRSYQRQRRADIHTMTGMTDGLVRLFSIDVQTLGHLRNLGLALTNRIPLLKRLLTRHAMGLGVLEKP